MIISLIVSAGFEVLMGSKSTICLYFVTSDNGYACHSAGRNPRAQGGDLDDVIAYEHSAHSSPESNLIGQCELRGK